MQQCSLAVPGRVCLHTGTRHTHTHTHNNTHEIFTHKAAAVRFEVRRNVQTECIRWRFEHLHEQLPHCFMPPPPAMCQPLLRNIFAVGTHVHVYMRAHFAHIYLYTLQVNRKSISVGLSGPKSAVWWLSCSPELSWFVDSAKLLRVKQRDGGGDGTGRERYG